MHSFGRDYAPYDAIAPAFRTDLAQRSPVPINFIEANLDFTRAANEEQARAFVEYLNARFDDDPPDAVVTLGAPAARFYLGRRPVLFPSTPLVLGALEERFASQAALLPGDAAVAERIDVAALVDNIVQVLPETETIAVVIGASSLERFWLDELKREFARYAGRIKFEWLDSLSLVQMQERVAGLPPHSAILYALLTVDAAGVPHERQDALAKLYKTSNAPIFGFYEYELGKGVVGGPYWSQQQHAERLATATLRALEGKATEGTPQVDVKGFRPAVYDWRELRRWRIDESLLPPGSTIRFKPPSAWEEHRVAVVATGSALALQALLIGALLVQRRYRRRAEVEAEGLSGRLVTAHEDERRRLARELHDDVTQRLAGIAIDAARLEGGTRNTPSADIAHSIREGIAELGEDVHALSYRLHPSVIEDLGLVEALRIECDRVAGQGTMKVTLDCGDLPAKMPPDTALCLFRVAQEALRNVARHARAGKVDVSVASKDRGIALAVRDDGVGFDTTAERQRASLGLASMRERVRLLGGRMRIESRPGSGTALSAWVPLAEAA